MATVNKLISATVVCNLFIIVGIGHGGAPIGLVEPMLLHEILNDEIAFTFLGGYSSRLPACAFLSTIGQLILIIACFLHRTLKLYITLFGLAILYFALFALTIGFSPSGSESVSLLFSLPFLYASIRLMIFLFRNSKEPAIAD
jgi:hypothetical protein